MKRVFGFLLGAVLALLPVMAGAAELNLHTDQTGSGLIAEFDALVFQFICF